MIQMRYLKTGLIKFRPVFICLVMGTDNLPAWHILQQLQVAPAQSNLIHNHLDNMFCL